MQSIIVEKPYQFIPPRPGTWLPKLAIKMHLIDWYLRRFEGVYEHEVQGAEHLEASLRAGDGILIAPNHCRYADPLAMGFISRRTGCYPYAMASWHLFHGNRLRTWAMRAVGAFSIYREGTDRQSLDAAIDILATAKRPLCVFPEGAVFRTNDRLQELLDGVSLMTRAAAKRRSKLDSPGKVVVHPVAIKYIPLAAVGPMVEPILGDVERRLTWDSISSRGMSQVQRARRALQGILCLKEIEYFGELQGGPWIERQSNLIDRVLEAAEQDYLGQKTSGGIIARIKVLRVKIMPELLKSDLPDSQRRKHWDRLAQIYLAQQIASYPFDYLTLPTTESRLLETAERLYEDLTDTTKLVKPLKVILRIGPAIQAPTQRIKDDEGPDLMEQLRICLQTMLDDLSKLPKSIT